MNSYNEAPLGENKSVINALSVIEAREADAKNCNKRFEVWNLEKVG